MKTMHASQSFYDNSMIEESEFSLAISPCPRIEASQGVRERADCACEYGGPVHRRLFECPRNLVLEEDGPAEILTIGWAIALASAAGLILYVSGV